MNPNPLLEDVRRNCPDLDLEDAFIVPQWFSHQDFWLSDPDASDNAAYNCLLALRIRGSLNVDALKRTVPALVQQHEALRSVFRLPGKHVTQIVLSSGSAQCDFVEHDLSSLSDVDRESKAWQILQSEARQPFDLTRGPLVRARLIRLDAIDHVFCLATHLLVCDDWSTGILLKDLFHLYDDFSKGGAPSLEKPSSRYGDFARGLAARQLNGEFDANTSFWTEQLPRTGRFEYLAPNKTVQKRPLRPAACEKAIFSAELAESLKLLSQKERSSLFMTMVAGFQWLLQSYSGKSDIGIGSCAANRLRPELEGLVGRFGNDVVLRTKLDEHSTFRDVLQRIREVALNAYSFQEVPFGGVLRRLRSANVSSLDSLCQIMFIFQNAPKAEKSVPGLEIEKIQIDPEYAKFDLNVWLRVEDGLTVVLEYDADVFSADHMKRLLCDYQQVLANVAGNPETRIENLSLSGQWPRAKAAPASNNGKSHVNAGSDEIETRLIDIWESAFGQKGILASSNFFELGGDSLLASRLFPRMEREFNVQLPLATLFTAPTIREIARIIREPAGKNSSSQFVVPIQTAGLRPPFFCFHGAGGNVLIYRDLSRRLGTDQPFYGLQCQGLDGKQPCLTSIEEMSAEYLKDIRRISPHGPYFLGGYCMGGILAMEAAQQLMAAGEDVALLALLDTINWSKITRGSLWSNSHHQWERLVFHARNFAQLSLGDQTKFFSGKLGVLRHRMNVWRGMLFGGSSEQQPEARSTSSILAEVWEANERATLNYVPKLYRGVITDFRPVKQYSQYVPGMMWEDLAQGGQQVITLPVFPAGMLLEPFVKELAGKLRLSIDHAMKAAALSH